ncbi:ATP-binding protein [Alteromonas sp. AMM-1]|uniref:ATP-binding protein n=1 Tax=Alteromonas sp. AMM-1 TaxID=3394233 RepID=UPI0039A61DB6
MRSLSLRVRSLLIACVALVVFIPVTVLTLSQAYTSSLEEAKYNELKLMTLSLISVFEMDDGAPVMPDMLFDEQLNLPNSGYLGVIQLTQATVWISASGLETHIESLPASPDVGGELYVAEHALDGQHPTYFAYSYTAEFEDGDNYLPVTFFVFNNNADFENERRIYLRSVWQYLIALGLGLIVLLVLGMNTLLKPVRALISEIEHTSNGQQQQLTANYPSEFTPLKQSINALLSAEAEQRQRYKNSLGDLAHSLKTPLAVALGTQGLPASAQESLQQIDALIQRQLKRATAGTTSWDKGIAIAPVAQQISNALNKVYRDKALQIAVNGEQGQFFGDKTDLMEILGNLMDNACKAAERHIQVTINETPYQTELYIEDDGPGIPPEQVERLLTRGQRLDSYTEGQGIGMAVVADLLAAYEAKLAIGRSELGGAMFTITFPAPIRMPG